MNDKNDIGFKQHTLNGEPVYLTSEREFLEGQKMFFLNSDNLFYAKPKPDTRSKLRKLFDEAKRRITHAWYALKGYDCD